MIGDREHASHLIWIFNIYKVLEICIFFVSIRNIMLLYNTLYIVQKQTVIQIWCYRRFDILCMYSTINPIVFKSKILCNTIYRTLIKHKQLIQNDPKIGFPLVISNESFYISLM